MSLRGHFSGFTLPELVVSVAILLAILAFGSVNLLRILPNADLARVSAGFLADVKSQQNSAMRGEGPGLSLPIQSIKIESNAYILFRGRTYTPDPSSYRVELPDTITASTSFPDGVISFSSLTGDIEDFNADDNEVSFVGPNNIGVTLRFNKLGNVYYVNKI